MAEHYDSDPPEEIGGVPVDSGIGELPPIDDEYGDPVEPQIPRKHKEKHKEKDKQRFGPQMGAGRRSGCRWPFVVVMGCVMLCCACWMAFCAIVAVAGGGAAVMASNEVTEDGTSQLAVEVDADTVITLTVDNPTGQVRVRPGSSDQVRVEYTKKAFGLTKSQADNGLKDITVTLDNPDGADQFTITATKGDGLLRVMDHVNMTVYVPQDVHLVIDTNTGEIDVTDVTVHSMNLTADTGAITFAGTIGADGDALFNLKTNTGAVVAKLPANIDARIDASTDTGSVDVAASDFIATHVEHEDANGPSQSWLGTLGEGSGNAPKLVLRSNTGAIVVEVR